MATQELTKIRKLDLTTTTGTLIEDVDLSKPLEAHVIKDIWDTLLRRGVIFFRNQNLDDDQMQTAFGQFGNPIPEPAASIDTTVVSETDMAVNKFGTAVWHIDDSFMPVPPAAVALRAAQLPPVGGDTMWSLMGQAYDDLSPTLQKFLDGLTAFNSVRPSEDRIAKRFGGERSRAVRADFETIQPVVRVHPETGRKSLFVSECSTTRIMELSEPESDALLQMLFAHQKRAETVVRWRWTVGDIAVWDNRAVLHYAIPDYEGPRYMQRMVLEGDRPVGPR